MQKKTYVQIKAGKINFGLEPGFKTTLFHILTHPELMIDEITQAHSC